MISAWNKATGEIVTWEIPTDGVLKTWLPSKCKADCCDLECEHGEDDLSCQHTTHPEKGQCVVSVTLDPQEEPIYTCLGQIARGSNMSDCLHATLAECHCPSRARWQAEIDAKNSPARVVGGQRARGRSEHAAMVRDGLARRRSRT